MPRIAGSLSWHGMLTSADAVRAVSLHRYFAPNLLLLQVPVVDYTSADTILNQPPPPK